MQSSPKWSQRPVHAHTWIGVTCTELRIFSECGKTEGNHLGHDILPATRYMPATCSRCGYTEGELLTFPNSLDWSIAQIVDFDDAVEAFIRYVTVEDSITTIGVTSFCDYYNLEEILLPSSVMEIGTGFFWCSSLKRVTPPAGVAVIDFEIF